MSFLRHKNGPLKNQLSKPTIIAIHQRESISANPWVQLIPKLCGTVCERQQNAALLISAKNHRRKPLKNKKYLSAAKKEEKVENSGAKMQIQYWYFSRLSHLKANC